MELKSYIFHKGAARHIPVSGTFELTPRCNLQCEMCYIRMSSAEQKQAGRERTADEWIALGREAVDAGMVYLLLTGGEPLLRADFPQIYRELAKMGVVLSLNTNGTLLTDGILECLCEHPPEKVNVTLYGASSATYEKVCGSAAAFSRASDAIRRMKQAGIPVFINTTFTKNNASDMEDIVSFAREVKAPIRMTSYVFPPVRCAREAKTDCLLPPDAYGALAARFDLLTLDAEQKKRRRQTIDHIMGNMEPPPADEKSRASSCMAGRGAFWITWDGKLLPCGMLPASAVELGNSTFREAWERLPHVMNRIQLPVECSTCRARRICSVCAAVTQNAEGDPSVPPRDLCRYAQSYLSRFLKSGER